jgi:UDPglucose 6-dehydrogenase
VSEHGDPTIAEFIKCAHNAYNATKISFWNEMWQVAQHLDVAADEVAQVVAQSAEASWNPLYGIRGGRAFDGACLPKDTRALVGFGESCGVEMPLMTAVCDVNSAMADSESVPADLHSASARSRS